MSFFSTPLSQSSGSMGSLACEKVVGRVRRNSAKRDWCGGGGGGYMLLVGLHVVESLQHGLHQLSLGGE
jgi:hypothetical protein